MNVLHVTNPAWTLGPEAEVDFGRYPRIDESTHETDIQIRRGEGVVHIQREFADDAFHITLHPRNREAYVPKLECRTTFSIDLIQSFLDRSDFAWLCDNIARHDDAGSTPRMLKKQLFSYGTAQDFAGKRLLDFGCGNGGSTLAMARLLPETEIIGVELDQERIEFADRIKSFRGVDNVRFLCSPCGTELPHGIGSFDFVMLSAVYEHLLPNERTSIMPLLFRSMNKGGRIFINQTPYRYSPLEAHSTGLWFVNYLPDKVTHFLVRHLAGRNQQINQSKDWNVHLRGGLRGGTEKEILRNLTEGDLRKARIVQPKCNGVTDRASFWRSCTNPKRFRLLKQLIEAGFRLTDRCWGTIPGLNLEVVVEKLS